MPSSTSKKRKALRNSESLLGGVEGEGEGDGEDRISHLPDCLLYTILSLLPVQDSAQTSVLSSRWRCLWTSVPLDLDDSSLTRRRPPAPMQSDMPRTHAHQMLDETTWRIRAIDHILTRHPGPVRAFRVSGFPSRALDGWLDTLVRRGVQELSLCHYCYASLDDSSECYLLPPCLLGCQSLQSLKLQSCRFPEPLVARPAFTNLRELNLDMTILWEDTISDVLSSCKLLETLILWNSPNSSATKFPIPMPIVICSPSLRSLTVYNMTSEIRKLIIEDVPNLERLMLGEILTKKIPVRVRHASKLKVLGIVHANAKMFELEKTCFERKKTTTSLAQGYSMGKCWSLSSTSNQVCSSLKKLAIKVNFDDDHQSNTVSGLLRCFPCLESLDVLVFSIPSQYAACSEYCWEEQGPYDCIDLHLKSVTLDGFVGAKCDLGFAKFLVAKAQVLKTMTLICGCTWSRRWEETKRHQLCLENRLSLDLQVDLMKENNRGCVSTWKFLQ